MTRDEVIAGLLTCARQSDDSAASCEAVARHHRPEFERSVHSMAGWPETHARVVELHGHVVNNEHEARRLHGEAELFRAAAELLQSDVGEIESLMRGD